MRVFDDVNASERVGAVKRNWMPRRKAHRRAIALQLAS
jgi:hypothetical protein